MQSILQHRRIHAKVQQQHHGGESKPSSAAVSTGYTEAGHAESGAQPSTPTIVTFDDEHDPLNPQNWTTGKKAITFSIISFIGLVVGFGSAIDAPLIPQASARFHVSDTTESLATALYLIGFGCGAPFAGPFSEAFGRNMIYLTTSSLFCCWILGSALAPNIGAQLVFRFLAGFFGSTPFTTAGGSLSDIFTHQQRAMVFPLLALFAFAGPILAPVVGGYIGNSGLDWRWAEWITLCIAGGILAIMFLFLPETYAPLILTWKAQALRKATGNSSYQSQLELSSKSLIVRVRTALTRPFITLFTEPILMAFTLYLTLVYAVIFSFFDGAPFIFTEIYHFNQGATYLMFVAIMIGLTFAVAATPLFMIPIKKEFSKAKEAGLGHAPPEAMLWQAMIGAPLLPISLWWMAWSSFPSVSYWSPIISAVPLGFSVLAIFISTYAYLIQTFVQYAASALASITLVRYIISGSMVIVSLPMYKNLGVHNSLTILAAISTAFTPLPYLFYFYGSRIRAMSRAAPTKG